MKIFVFGNPDLSADSLPLRILPQLVKQWPQIEFVVADPNEEWEVPENLILIDTVQGLSAITEFTNLDDFVRPPKITMHDFDAYTNLRYLQKLGKLKKIKIIGLPPAIDAKTALAYLTEKLKP
ncbi:MAG: hypothetical protein Q8N81_05855 [bacterium]|nr:hypothetical protein [bacterium]